MLTVEQKSLTQFLRESADSAQDEYRDWVVGLLAGGCSFSEVSKATGLSTNTLQRWKREAGAEMVGQTIIEGIERGKRPVSRKRGAGK